MSAAAAGCCSAGGVPTQQQAGRRGGRGRAAPAMALAQVAPRSALVSWMWSVPSSSVQSESSTFTGPPRSFCGRAGGRSVGRLERRRQRCASRPAPASSPAAHMGAEQHHHRIKAPHVEVRRQALDADGQVVRCDAHVELLGPHARRHLDVDADLPVVGGTGRPTQPQLVRGRRSKRGRLGLAAEAAASDSCRNGRHARRRAAQRLPRLPQHCPGGGRACRGVQGAQRAGGRSKRGATPWAAGCTPGALRLPAGCRSGRPSSPQACAHPSSWLHL